LRTGQGNGNQRENQKQEYAICRRPTIRPLPCCLWAKVRTAGEGNYLSR
jgi:hypothetical protein